MTFLTIMLGETCSKSAALAICKAGRFVLGIVLCLQYLSVLGLPNTYYGYWFFPIQYNTIQQFFLEKILKHWIILIQIKNQGKIWWGKKYIKGQIH